MISIPSSVDENPYDPDEESLSLEARIAPFDMTNFRRPIRKYTQVYSSEDTRAQPGRQTFTINPQILTRATKLVQMKRGGGAPDLPYETIAEMARDAFYKLVVILEEIYLKNDPITGVLHEVEQDLIRLADTQAHLKALDMAMDGILASLRRLSSDARDIPELHKVLTHRLTIIRKLEKVEPYWYRKWTRTLARADEVRRAVAVLQSDPRYATSTTVLTLLELFETSRNQEE